MDSEERTHLDQLMKELREICVSKASVLFSTENNMATGLYEGSTFFTGSQRPCEMC